MTNHPMVSPRRRTEIINALRRGTVPAQGLDALSVGLEPFLETLDEELSTAKSGGAIFKAVRGEYGAGKTFFSRHLAARALAQGFATAEVQISETETPLHRLETVYRRICESLRTPSVASNALRPILDSWIHTIEDETDTALGQDVNDTEFETALEHRVSRRLKAVSAQTPDFALLLRAYRQASVVDQDEPQAEALVGLLGGQPRIAAATKRYAGIRGDLDHFGAMGFLQGLLTVLRDAGHPGLLVVLDEVETIQRMRRDSRERALNALRQLVDEIDSGRYPGLYLLITGTPPFFDGQSGIGQLQPLADRLSTDFSMNPKFDNPRAVQIRLHNFTYDKLIEMGSKIRGLYSQGATDSDRLLRTVDDAYLRDFAHAIAGELGGNVGIAPRQFARKLVDLLDRVDQFPDFDPRTDYSIQILPGEMDEVERNAAARRADDIELDL